MSEENTQEIVPGSPEYDEQLAAKYRNQGDAGEVKPDVLPVDEKPEGGHDKFYNVETGAYDWKSHAVELEYRAKQGQKGEDEKPEEATSDDTPSEAELDDIYKKAGLDPAELEQQIVANGAIDAVARAALNKQGIPNSMIDTFVSGFVADTKAAGARVNEQLEAFGGQAEFDKQQAWALDNLTPTELTAFNKAMQSDYWKYAAQDMQTRYKGSKPLAGEKQLIKGDGISTTSSGYRSKAEMKADMGSPQYSKDPVFRQQVAQKMKNATWDLNHA